MEVTFTGVGIAQGQEADILIMLHAAEISKAGKNVHIMTQDTEVMNNVSCQNGLEKVHFWNIFHSKVEMSSFGRIL